MFAMALFTTANIWKQRRGPSTGEEIHKWWYIHTMKYYSVIKRNERATIWMNFKYIMISERSQIHKAPYYMILFIRHSGKGKTVGTKNKSAVTRVCSEKRV